jgi:hypothetical protein
MLVLLDENLLSRKLKQPITEDGYSVFNVDNMGWRGTKDRDLLFLADAYPFDVLIAADKNLPYQQNVSIYQLRILFSILPVLNQIVLLAAIEDLF